MAKSIPKIPGKAISLSGEEYVVPPLSLASMETNGDRIGQFRGGVDAQSASIVIDVVHAALLRNYPELTREEVANGLDLGNMNDAFEAVLNLSGYQAKAEEGAPSGE